MCEHLVYNSQGPRFAFRGYSQELSGPNISTNVFAWNKLHESYYECLLHLQNLTSMIVVYLSLPIVRVRVFLGLFLIGHTLTTSTSPKIGSVWMIWTSNLLCVPSGVVSNSPSPTPLLYCFSFHFFRVLWNRIHYCILGNSASRFLFVLTPFSECGRRPRKSMVTTSSEMDSWMPSPMRRARRCAMMGYLGEVLVKNIMFSFLSFLLLSPTRMMLLWTSCVV